MFLIIILAYIVVIGILNEKIFHLQSDIALIAFSLLFSVILLFVKPLFPNAAPAVIIQGLENFGFREYLMDGVLCFMLFAGASY